jgi:hypothetical protein
VSELKVELDRLRKELKVPSEAPREAYGNQPFGNEPGRAPKKKKKMM